MVFLGWMVVEMSQAGSNQFHGSKGSRGLVPASFQRTSRANRLEQMSELMERNVLEPVGTIWKLGTQSNENRIEALVIRVASLERAKAFLREKQLLGGNAAGQVTIEPSKIGGLDLRLVGR